MNASESAIASNPVYRPLMGIVLMCLAGTFFPVMNGVAKLMSQTYSSEQVVWARTLSHLVFLLLLFMPRYGVQVVRTRRPGIQVLRSALLIASTYLFFSAIKVVPIAQAAAVSFLSPLLVVLLAAPMLGERITPGRIAAVLAGFAGVLVVTRPGAAVFQPASLLIVGSATCYALYQVYTRRVAGIDSAATSSTYSALVGTVLMSAIVPLSWRTPDAVVDVLLLASLGVFGGLGHYCVARSLSCAPANLVSPFMYWQMVGSVIVGYLLFSEVPDAFTWLGAAMIIGAGLWVGMKASSGKPAAG
jgi:drug/metabolite transporter (DMT)-like permease